MGQLVETEKKEMSGDVACLDVGPVPEGRQRSRFLAVGSYDNTVASIRKRRKETKRKEKKRKEKKRKEKKRKEKKRKEKKRKEKKRKEKKRKEKKRRNVHAFQRS